MSDARTNVAAAVLALAGAIDRGECRPTRAELEALRELCVRERLHLEAARVRRWILEYWS